MARLLRIGFAGALYDVTSREDRLKFLGVLAEVTNRLNWLCHAREDQGAEALLIVAGDITTAVAEYPDNVGPHKQISKAPAPFCWMSP